MIRVMNIISDTNIGGAGRVLLNYLKYCDTAEFDVSTALPRGSALAPRIRALGSEVYELDIAGDISFDRAAIPAITELIKREKPDIVHTHGSLSGRIAARRCGCRIVYTRHCAFPVRSVMRHGPGRWANRLLNMHYADRVIAVGPAARDSLTESGIPEYAIDMMMNGCEPVMLPDAVKTDELRSRYGLGNDDFVIGIIARIEKYKGHDDIIDAMKLLAADGITNVRLIVAGAGEYEAELREHAAAKLPEGSVIFAGFIDDVSEILAVIDVQINASYESETSSLSVIEGLSAGVPAIVSDCGGNPLLVDDGVSGLIFHVRDSAGLAGCIKKMAADPQLLASLGEGSRRIYNERFTGGQFARNVENVYRRVMKGGNDGK